MMIFCDFDHTLFNTSSLVEDYKKICLRYGIDEAKWDEILSRFSSIASEKSLLFSNKEFCNQVGGLYGKHDSHLEEELNQLVKESAKEWLFSDTVAFLKKYKKENLAIITFGDDLFQSQKVQYSGIADFFSFCEITGGHKAPVIQKLITDNALQGPFYFLDDKPEHFIAVKQMPVNVITILLGHKERQKEVMPTDSCDHVATSLLGASEIIDYKQ